MKYMDMEIDPNKLRTMAETLSILENEGADYHAIEALRTEQMEQYGQELIWRYPLSDSISLGAFIIPVREGFLWVPYDEVELERGELLLLNNAALLDEEAGKYLAIDWKLYADGLNDALRDIIAAVSQNSQELR